MGHLLPLLLSKSPPSRKWAAHQHHHHHHYYYYYYYLRKRSSWNRYFLRFFLFFLLGFFLGLSPFAYLLLDAHPAAADLRPHHFFFDSIHTLKATADTSLRQQDTETMEIDAKMLKSRDLVSLHTQHNVGNINANRIRMGMEKNKGNDEDKESHDSPLLPPPSPQHPKLLIIVTPTYNRALQAYFLNRLGQTLRLVPPPLLWLVVEMNSASSETADILRRTGVMYRHLVCHQNSTNIKDRGVHQRNTALHHIERHHLNGIVYFADDDNIYSLHLFHHLRHIKRFGSWPVAMLAQNKNKAILEGPVCWESQVIGWHTNEKSKRLRRFHVDMSGFAFNSTILWDPKLWQRPTSDAIRQLDTVKEGFQETTFIEQLVEDESRMEGLPYGCSRIMNWHLHLEARHLVYPEGWQVPQNLNVITSLQPT